MWASLVAQGASACNAGDLGFIPELGRSPGEGKGYPLQYPGLEHSMDCIVHGVAKSRTRLSDFCTHTHTHNTLAMVNKIKNVIYRKLTHHCKSTTLQLKRKRT